MTTPTLAQPVDANEYKTEQTELDNAMKELFNRFARPDPSDVNNRGEAVLRIPANRVLQLCGVNRSNFQREWGGKFTAPQRCFEGFHFRFLRFSNAQTTDTVSLLDRPSST